MTYDFIQNLEPNTENGKEWNMFRTFELVEAISRAIASVTIAYIDGDVLLSQIKEQFKNISPEICPNNNYKKKPSLEVMQI
jgi:hypothetical protein